MIWGRGGLLILFGLAVVALVLQQAASRVARRTNEPAILQTPLRNAGPGLWGPKDAPLLSRDAVVLTGVRGFEQLRKSMAARGLALGPLRDAKPDGGWEEGVGARWQVLVGRGCEALLAPPDGCPDTRVLLPEGSVLLVPTGWRWRVVRGPRGTAWTAPLHDPASALAGLTTIAGKFWRQMYEGCPPSFRCWS
jgi:hypothetical protein